MERGAGSPGAGGGNEVAALQFERELQIARGIQASFLPPELPRVPGWEIAARFQPAREVAGDFYDAFTLTTGRRLALIVADVCDKGIGAAIFMALCRSLLRVLAQQHHALDWGDLLADPLPVAGASRGRRGLPAVGTTALRNAVTLTNNYVATNHGDINMFATLFFGVLDPATGALSYVNCGHDPPLIVGPSGAVKRLPRTGPALGLLPDLHFDVAQDHIGPGDTLIGYTDGVTEARAADRSFFTEERLLRLACAPARSAAAVLDRLCGDLDAHIAGADPSDDITLLAARRLPGGAARGDEPRLQ